MMKLSTMVDIGLVWGSEKETPLPDSLVDLWFRDYDSVEFIRISANCVLRFKAEDRAFVLRVNSERERSVEQWAAEIGFVNYLAESGLRVAKPVLSRNGSCVGSVETAMGLLHASVFEAMPGRICYELSDLTPGMLTAWGHALGALHQQSQGYVNGAGRPSWRDHLRLIETYLPTTEQGAWKQLEQVRAKLDKLPVNDGSFGLIHFDFELDNIVWDGDSAGIIDFDDCAYYWYAADIAFALRDLFEDRADRVDLNSEPYGLFIQGYRAARDIGEDDLHLIPLFLRMHNLMVFAKLVRTLEDGRQPIEPEWMDGLRTKLLNALQRYRDAFAEYPDLE